MKAVTEALSREVGVLKDQMSKIEQQNNTLKEEIKEQNNALKEEIKEQNNVLKEVKEEIREERKQTQEKLDQLLLAVLANDKPPGL